MNADMTRRTLLQLAGASSLAAAAVAAARAEEGVRGGPTFANRTPMRIGMVTIRVRKLDAMADYYRDVLGLAVMERSAASAVLGAGGVKLLVLEARPDAANEARTAAGLYHTAFLMPTRKDLARWLVNAAIHRVPLSGFADHLVSESVYLDDPEGNGIEVYADRDPTLWKWSDGAVAMATDQLDIDNLVRSPIPRSATTRMRPMACASGMCICASAISPRPTASTAARSASTRRARATGPHSCPPAAIIIISVSTSGKAPVPAGATIPPPALPGFRWRSRRRICSRQRKNICVRRASR
jgi:catechol 2,3-dioxygenase-like lactoylglutathione lyase family enzyme